MKIVNVIKCALPALAVATAAFVIGGFIPAALVVLAAIFAGGTLICWHGFRSRRHPTMRAVLAVSTALGAAWLVGSVVFLFAEGGLLGGAAAAFCAYCGAECAKAATINRKAAVTAGERSTADEL